MLIRFVCSANSVGIFQAAHDLQDGDDLGVEDREELGALLAWFEKSLATPDRFVRTTSKGHYRREPAALSWFKDDAKDCIDRVWCLVRLLEKYGIATELIRTSRPGYVTYEDASRSRSRARTTATPQSSSDSRPVTWSCRACTTCRRSMVTTSAQASRRRTSSGRRMVSGSGWSGERDPASSASASHGSARGRHYHKRVDTRAMESAVGSWTAPSCSARREPACGALSLDTDYSCCPPRSSGALPPPPPHLP